MSGVDFIDLAEQDAPIRQELRDAVLGVMERGDYILGDAIDAFEDAFARYCGTRHAVGVSSGLAALELILRGYGIGPGDEVLVPAHTFVATAGAVAMTGATPVLVDVDPTTYNLDAQAAERAVTSATRAVLGVHLYGRPYDVDGLRALAERHGLRLIEDAAQAHGATYRDARAGSLGDAAAFSFYPTKNLGASGDAGAITTDDGELAHKLRALRNCGQYRKNEHVHMPYNHRMDTLQAAVLQVRLTRLDGWNEARRQVADAYRSALADFPLALPPEDEPHRRSVYHLFVIRSERRDELGAFLKARGIATALHYPIPVHLQEALRYLGHREGDFPIAESHARSVLSLPMHPGLTAEDVDRVAAGLRDFFRAS